MEVLKYFVIIINGYIIGSVSFSILISRIIHKSDIRERGSGNAGATNMARSYGLTSGLGTLFGDMFKTCLALLNGYFILGRMGLCIAAIACLLGHCYPVFYDFKGGKGISVGAIIAFAIDPMAFLIILAVFLIAAFASRKVSVGSVLAAFALPIAVGFLHCGADYLILSIVAAALVIIRHRPNIIRILHGEEPDFELPKHKRKQK